MQSGDVCVKDMPKQSYNRRTDSTAPFLKEVNYEVFAWMPDRRPQNTKREPSVVCELCRQVMHYKSLTRHYKSKYHIQRVVAQREEELLALCAKIEKTSLEQFVRLRSVISRDDGLSLSCLQSQQRRVRSGIIKILNTELLCGGVEVEEKTEYNGVETERTSSNQPS